MKEKGRVVLVLAVALLAGTALWATLSWAAPGRLLAPPEVIPPVVAYQGEVQVGSSPYTGHGYFKFAVVDAAGATTYWSNDGSSGDGGEPAEAVPLTVSEGLFSVLLGDTSRPGMTEPLGSEVFGEPECHLRVWFSPSEGGPFEQLTPDTRIAAVPYALRAQEAVNADTLDGLHASQLKTDYDNVVVVAKSGGDYASVQAAVDSIGDAAADNAYLVWVAPGVYSETVTMKAHVHLQGAGQEVTVISSAASSEAWPPTEATLRLASDASLRDLAVGNSGAGHYNVALLATAGVTGTLVSEVTARVQGGGINNWAVFVLSAGTEVTLQQVTALAENGIQYNYGLYSEYGTVAMVHGGSFTGRGGMNAYGINIRGDTMLEAEGVTALGENGSNANFGLANRDGAAAILQAGSFAGRGGTYGRGIVSGDSGTTLVAEHVTSLGEQASDIDNGLWNGNGAAATLRGGSFTGRGGGSAAGIHNENGATILDAEGVSALAENGDDNHGLENGRGAAAVLRGGSFSGSGGWMANGIYSSDPGTALVADGVTALAEGGSGHDRGLLNLAGSAATLRGGSFTARGPGNARGVENSGSGSTLLAEGIAALGEHGTNSSAGLLNTAAATLRGGWFTGHGGAEARGIYNTGTGATLEAEGVAAVGEDGSGNMGLYNVSNASAQLTQSVLAGSARPIYRSSGDVTVSNSRLVGGAVYGTVTCILVTRDGDVSTDGFSCP